MAPLAPHSTGPSCLYQLTASYSIQTYAVVVLHRSVVSNSAVTWTTARQAPLSTGFSRQGHWSRLPCPPPGDLPSPKDRTYISCTAGRFFTHWEAPIQTYTDPQINTSTHNQQPTESPILSRSCRGLTVPHSQCSIKAFKTIMMHGSYPLLTGQPAAEKVVHEWSSQGSYGSEPRAVKPQAKAEQAWGGKTTHTWTKMANSCGWDTKHSMRPERTGSSWIKELPRFSFYLLLPSRTERFLHPKWDSGWPWWFFIGSKPPPATAHPSLTILHPETMRHEDF